MKKKIRDSRDVIHFNLKSILTTFQKLLKKRQKNYKSPHKFSNFYLVDWQIDAQSKAPTIRIYLDESYCGFFQGIHKYSFTYITFMSYILFTWNFSFLFDICTDNLRIEFKLNIREIDWA